MLQLLPRQKEGVVLPLRMIEHLRLLSTLLRPFFPRMKVDLIFGCFLKGDVPERGLNCSNGKDTLPLKPVYFVVPLSPHTS